MILMTKMTKTNRLKKWQNCLSRIGQLREIKNLIFLNKSSKKVFNHSQILLIRFFKVKNS